MSMFSFKLLIMEGLRYLFDLGTKIKVKIQLTSIYQTNKAVSAILYETWKNHSNVTRELNKWSIKALFHEENDFCEIKRMES